MGVIRIADAEAFAHCAQRGVAKLALRSSVIERPDGLVMLRTKTFVHCPDRRIRLMLVP